MTPAVWLRHRLTSTNLYFLLLCILSTKVETWTSALILTLFPRSVLDYSYLPLFWTPLPYLTSAVLNLWVATPAEVAWRFTRVRLRPSEICKQSCQRMNFFNVSYWILTQVFCCDIIFLFSRHQLYVKQNFQFAGSSSGSLLPRQVHLVKVATPLAAGPHL